jgi:hypothetical protein
MLLPMATPRLRSILSLAATNTAVMCSQALPAMGSTMKPRKLRLRPHVLLTCQVLGNKGDAEGVQVRDPEDTALQIRAACNVLTAHAM